MRLWDSNKKFTYLVVCVHHILYLGSYLSFREIYPKCRAYIDATEIRLLVRVSVFKSIL